MYGSSSSCRCAAPGSPMQARIGGVPCTVASLLASLLTPFLALALPSAAPAAVDAAGPTGREADLTWTARWDDLGFGLDVADDAGRSQLAWTVSDPLRCAVRHQLLDGLSLEGGASFAPETDAWRRLMLEDAPAAGQFADSELFRLDATVELVAELGDRRTGTAWRVGLGGGWSRAESVLGTGMTTDGGSLGLESSLDSSLGGSLGGDLSREGVGTASDASGEGVVWLRFSRAF